MKKNYVALILIVLIAPVAIWLMVKNGKSTMDQELTDFAVKDTAAVTRLFLADKNNHQVTLDRNKDGSWTVNKKYKARQDLINTLLYTIKNVEVKSPVGLKARQNVLRQLASRVIKMEIYQGEKLVKLYYVGYETMDQSGTFMLMADPETRENASSPFVTHIPSFNGYLTPRYVTNEEDWRDRIVFGYYPPDIASIQLDYKTFPKNSFELLQPQPNTFEVKLPDHQMLAKVDPLQAKQYLSYFQNINFEFLANHLRPSYKDSVLKAGEKLEMTVTDRKGKKNVVHFYERLLVNSERQDEHGKPLLYDPDKMFASINNGQDFVVIQYFIFGKLFQTPSYFTALDAAPSVKK